ncbi:MAG: putative ABC transporter permease [Saccharofermentans sp.]|nr:putative ABC transporter permease [Saccharofermentans sp.]
MTLYDICWYFILYSFIGWIIEVVFHAVKLGKIMNRGFLNGPVCPVYGFGMVAVLSVYNSIGIDNIVVIFIEGIILTTSIELLAGFILDKAFHARWWNYSNVPLNLNGYICLRFSIIWGVAVAFVLKLFNPTLYAFTIKLIKPRIGWPILAFLIITFIVDTVVTALTLIGLNKQLNELDNISKRLHVVSDKLTQDIGEGSINAAQKIQTAQIKYSLAKAELKQDIEESELEVRNQLLKRSNEIKRKITSNKHFGSGRLINVFPNATHNQHSEFFNELKARIHNDKQN